LASDSNGLLVHEPPHRKAAEISTRSVERGHHLAILSQGLDEDEDLAHGYELVVWSAGNPGAMVRLPFPSWISMHEFSRAGSFMVGGDRAGHVAIIDLDGRKVRHLEHRSSIGAGAFSPDGRLVATGDAGGHITISDVASATPVAQLTYPARLPIVTPMS